jgi:hypothetical protein
MCRATWLVSDLVAAAAVIDLAWGGTFSENQQSIWYVPSGRYYRGWTREYQGGLLAALARNPLIRLG